MADQKPYIEIRADSAGGSMENFPVYDQHDLADCYSYSATQYWDAARYLNSSQKSSFRPSSADYAAIFSSSLAVNGDGDWNDGYARPTVEFLNSHGGCTLHRFESVKTQQADFLSEFSSLYYGAYFPRVLQAKQKLSEAKTSLEIQVAQERVQQTQADFDVGKALLSNILEKAGHPMDDATLDYKLKNSRSLTDFTIDALKIECDEKVHFSAPVPTLHSIEALVHSGKDVLKEPEYLNFLDAFKQDLIAHFLKNQKRSLPVMIAYCSSFFKYGNTIKGVDRNELRCESHESVVTGIRYANTEDPDSVQVLIRNTRGVNCGGNLHPDFQCESGSIWVPLKVLNNNLLSYLI